ncbi:dimethylarginine dimethylaminohydrolase family protein [Sphaerobacter thermophilus]|uniref:arginine deiminase n=1 Tax=Sphaerobacter thermophilus (strain ATCC 49802 / DSM 20745 / KCCM 41009 / NCIMB 13125 / S 6022) TaxID=479434 RepID=D1C889_SPHTD|nr:arginine deiminase family protein [Sphaerobacter thermophilus]ACZ40032.1 amidinotransferase [Sphaerobacter thermophilus DSM 20745]
MARSTNKHIVSESYYQSFTPPEPEPGFNDPAEMEAVWGRVWGANSEVGQLRMVLMRRPGEEMNVIQGGQYSEEAEALVDPQGRWYWRDRNPPDLAKMQHQHDVLSATLRDEGVTVVYVEGVEGPFVKSVFTRDPLITVPGGAIIGRMAPRMRRGEEAYVTKTVAALGMPILGTIVGTGMLEGGSFVKLTPKVAAFGTSIRCNEEGAQQLREILARLGIELIVVPMVGWSIHLDGYLGMVDIDKALIVPDGLPYWFIDRLHSLGIETIPVHPEERWAVNSLCVRPGRIIMSEGHPYTQERLEKRGVEVITVPYDEIQKNGGGVHCSTMELVRDPV